MLKSKKSEREITANELTDVRDVNHNILYSKSGYAFGYLKLLPINIDLITDDEKEVKCNNLTAMYKPEKDMFSILSIPRTVDMEEYLSQLTTAYEQELENPIRREIIREMIRQASDTILNGENYEHQYYLKIWAKHNPNVTGTEKILHERLQNFESRYESVSNKTKEVDDTEILKLCNLYANSSTAVMESYEDPSYTPIPMIKAGSRK